MANREDSRKPAQEEISVKEIFISIRDGYQYLLRKWKLIFMFLVLGGTAGFIHWKFKKITYVASCTFVLEQGSGGGGLSQYSGIASMVGLDLGSGGGGIFEGDNLLEFYKSRSMIQKTLFTAVKYGNGKELLIDKYIQFKGLRKQWADNPKLKELSFNTDSSQKNRLQDSVLREIVKDIRSNYLNVSKPDKKLNIMQVQVTAEDEVFAKEFTDNIVKNVNDFYVQTKTKKSLENVMILQQKADSVRTVMNGAIYQSAAVADATPNLNPTRQVQRIAPVQRSQFSAETNKAILAELIKNLELSKMSLRKETPLIQVIDIPLLPLETNKMGLLKSIVFGVVLAGILIILGLLLNKVTKDIMS